jgi:8-oxo-dGTP pyrophosphatase MutT (NUDIX family)
MPPIAVKVMIVVTRPTDGALLVSGVPGNGRSYERPLGGTVEFGEPSAVAARREFREELGLELTELCLLGVLENRFELDGALSHEIVFVYTAELADYEAYQRREQPILDHPPTSKVRAYWRVRSATTPRLVPDGLEDLLAQTSNTVM